MPYPVPALAEVATTNGFLLVLSLVLPVTGVLAAFATGGRLCGALAGFIGCKSGSSPTQPMVIQAATPPR